mmetsp:Transcript_5472/g.20475  ORF Transcript_5472/g.20475 Transcript_5472/m.20475 type:complete len:644 (-) Transcript_5472:232-2163(-)|eukprot:CAMPEP_0117440824 /NCGR_PEP_ID=MMETSP0759-20121206/3296_1 /TAXON_ID=63605 /ORGANISM="Percolomonas cosmopolitus, Strain WS" /LENGTH=643 /DNA_ID=CAMNT_0005232615 /DNA_START=144 /DNA_END=2075 /DNA_ORIENTATION=+
MTTTIASNENKENTKYVPPHLRNVKKPSSIHNTPTPLNVNAPSFDCVEPAKGFDSKKKAFGILSAAGKKSATGTPARFRTPLKTVNGNNRSFGSTSAGSKSSQKKLAKTQSSKKLSKSAHDEEDDDDHKDTADNSGPYVYDQSTFEMLQHAVFSRGTTVASPNDNLKTIDTSAPSLNLDEQISLIEGTVAEDDKDHAQPWFMRLKNLASMCKVTITEDSTAAELVGSVLVYHVQHIIRYQWKYDRKINKISKLMIAFLSEIMARNLSFEWNRELMAQVLLARLVYSRQLGNKWIRRMWRTTEVTMQDVLSVDERRNTVYALFNCKTKKLYINCVQGGSMLEAFQWIAAQTQERVRMGNLQDIVITPSKSPQSAASSPATLHGSAVKKFDIYQDSKSPAKSPAANASNWRTPAKSSTPRDMTALASPKFQASVSPAASDVSSPGSVRSVQQPQLDPFGYIGKIGLQHWILMPLDTLCDDEGEFIEHRTKQRVHECRHRVVDNSLFFRKIKKPPKKMSSKRYNRFVELRQRQKQKRREEAIAQSETTTSTEEPSAPQHQGVVLEEQEIELAKPIQKTAEKKPQSLLVRKALKISIPEDDDCSTQKENTPTTPSSTKSFRNQLQSPRSALGALSPAVVSNRHNMTE